ncbi:MAG: hydratase [Peptococcaceae bacterium]|nr:hydratase [Peptococcaceae bacterium]
MITLHEGGAFLVEKEKVCPAGQDTRALLERQGLAADPEEGRKKTLAYRILTSHNTSGDMQNLKIRFDAIASHDITFVGIIQTARASGMTEFPLPYVLTNCHNSLCAVGGTINEDDHFFGLSAAKKYGGIYVPPHLAVIHQYMREALAGCGKMILGSDSHTRYGALGTMAIGEGGGELAKQLLRQTYDVAYPGVVSVYLTGEPVKGVGPQDVALAIIGAVFKNGFVKNKVLEFVGPGIRNLSMDYRNGIDVMTTETTCLSSIWCTDEITKRWLSLHGRGDSYRELAPETGAYYDGMIAVDLGKVRPMIALPMHPSNAYPIEELKANLTEILADTEKDCRQLIDNPQIHFSLREKIFKGRLKVDQGIIAGCAGGTYENISAAARIIGQTPIGQEEYSLSVYPSSQPIMLALTRNGDLASLMSAGAIIRSAFCGPCFGAGDVPANGSLSIRHTTRNFPSREGSKPVKGQIASVALMDARSIAATSLNHGWLTAATEIDYDLSIPVYHYDSAPYRSRVYQGFGKARPEEPLRLGPNITDWPEISAMPRHLLLKIVSYITDPVTTTDELIPSGETSSFRSNPLGLAEFTLSRKDPYYVAAAKDVRQLEKDRSSANLAGTNSGSSSPGAKEPRTFQGEGAQELNRLLLSLGRLPGFKELTAEDLAGEDFAIGSCIYARKPGDGSAREQAASCQRVLGAAANIAGEYATKRYRSNLINWGMLPFLYEGEPSFGKGDYLFIPEIRKALETDYSAIPAYVLKEAIRPITLSISPLTPEEADILKAGCLINYNQTR